MDTQVYTSHYHGWTITVKWELGAGYVAVIDDGLDDKRVVERAYSVREAKEFAIEDIDRMEALGDPFDTLVEDTCLTCEKSQGECDCE